jgi:hypothetical protein
MQLYSIPGDRTLGLTTRGVSTRDQKGESKRKDVCLRAKDATEGTEGKS